MASQGYYNSGPQYPQQSYGPPQGQYQQGYGPPPPQQYGYPPQQMGYQQPPPMQQGPPPKEKKDRGCLMSCLAVIRLLLELE
ncbi:hypothetical protein MBLNU13_g06487t1 [Cladosporium sp. NU13]